MVHVAVDLHAGLHLHQLAVHAHPYETLAAHAVEEFAVVTLAILHQGRQQHDALAGIGFQQQPDDLLLGVLHHRFARLPRERITRPGIEEAQEVEDFRRRAHGGTRVLVRRLLFDADDGREPRNLVHVGPFHAAEEVACIGRERFDVAALTLGIERVEGQRRLARAGQPGDDRQATARYGHVHILQVVDASTEDFYGTSALSFVG